MLNLAPAYGWAPRGERAIIRQPGKRTVTYTLILCVCPIGGLDWSLRSDTVDSEVFSEFIGRLPDGITLMLDNAQMHHFPQDDLAKLVCAGSSHNILLHQECSGCIRMFLPD